MIEKVVEELQTINWLVVNNQLHKKILTYNIILLMNKSIY